jgi:hypothetical protein
MVVSQIVKSLPTLQPERLVNWAEPDHPVATERVRPAVELFQVPV